MAFTYGFYNSLNHDRRYNSIQISMIFDGIIRDGIYATLGEKMVIKVSTEDDTVIVAPGRGWFDHTWNYNDADLPLPGEPSELILDRWDAVILDINSNENFRLNQIKWIKGTPSSNPVKPTMEKTLEHKQYPLAYVYRKANTTKINQEDIENRVGTEECPFVTGILDQISIDDLLLQWKDQWAQFVIKYEETASDWMQDQKDDFAAFYAAFKTQMNEFEQASGKEFSDWFAGIRAILSGDVAGNLQNEIDEINDTVFKHYYGLVGSSTEINRTTGVIKTTTVDGVSTTVFRETEDGKIITTTIVLNTGSFDYVKTTTIINTSVGKKIDTNYLRRPK